MPMEETAELGRYQSKVFFLIMELEAFSLWVQRYKRLLFTLPKLSSRGDLILRKTLRG